jgi:hypothetical protein
VWPSSALEPTADPFVRSEQAWNSDVPRGLHLAAEDIGKCALGIFKKGREFIGKTVGIASEHLTGTQMAAALTKALGQEVHYNAASPEVYRSFGFPGADDIGNMFQFKRDFQQVFCGARNPAVARDLNPALQTFDTWLARNKSRIPLE